MMWASRIFLPGLIALVVAIGFDGNGARIALIHIRLFTFASAEAADAASAYFPTSPPHASLPSAEQCATAVLSSPASAETRADNAVANHTVPTAEQLARVSCLSRQR